MKPARPGMVLNTPSLGPRPGPDTMGEIDTFMSDFAKASETFIEPVYEVPDTQFTVSKPGTRANSAKLLVTTARPSLRAWAAM